MDALVELSRLLQNVLRFGTVASVDHAQATCTVRTGALVTRALPWLVQRAGDARTWWAPSVGEQVLVLCPGGDTTRGVILPAIYSNAAPRPAGADTAQVSTYPDGAMVSYDPAAHALTATLPAGGTAALTASGGITLTGDTTLNGKLHVTQDVTVDTTLTATDDVIGGGKSLKGHQHTGVSAGTAISGPPQ